MSSLVVAGASSHREAPLISQDPVADNTDTYAYVAPDAPDKVTLIANWIPLEEPAGGPTFPRFGDDVLYSFNIDNNGDAVADVTYEFRFQTHTANPNTFLYNTGPITSLDDPDWNVRQTYSITEVRNGHRRSLGSNFPTPPVNIGPRSTPHYNQLAAAAIVRLPGGIKVFAGQRDDPFFVDLGSVFDLAGLRPLNGAHAIPRPTEAGVDGVAGYNVHSIVLQVPKSKLVASDPTIGVWSSTYRRQVKVLNDKGGEPFDFGNYVSVSRLGMPLVNEVVIPLGQKDRFNASEPRDDAQFGKYVLDPELSKLIPVLYPGVTVPPAPRNDLASIFLTGISGLNMQMNVHPAEMIRLNTSIPPTPYAQQNRLGLLAGQNDGFPNGRRLIDDVTDIELRALAGGTPFTPTFNHSPNNILTDGVDHNDKPLFVTFPYVPTPKSGYASHT
ncbi:MAG: DUF4331 domain-containing protein [Acidimicrobiia bacterium]